MASVDRIVTSLLRQKAATLRSVDDNNRAIKNLEEDLESYKQANIEYAETLKQCDEALSILERVDIENNV